MLFTLVVLMKWWLIKSTCAVQSLHTNLRFVKETARSLDCLVVWRLQKVGLVSDCLQPYYVNNQNLRNRTNTNIIRSPYWPQFTIDYYYYHHHHHHHHRVLSQAFFSRHFSWTSGDPHRSGFKFHTAVLSVLCVMFQVFCSESFEYFPGISSKFFLKLLFTIPVAPIITGIIVHFRFHIRCISMPKLLYCNFFPAFFCTTFLSAGIATSVSVNVSSFLFLIIISGPFAVTYLPVCTAWFHNPVTSLLLLLLLLLFIPITFKQGIYNYTSETHHVSRVYSVAALLYLQFVQQVMLLRRWNMFCTFTLLLSEVCVQFPIWLFVVVPRFRVVPVCRSGTVCMPLRWFQLTLLLLVSLLLSHTTCAEFLLEGLYILEFSQLLS